MSAIRIRRGHQQKMGFGVEMRRGSCTWQKVVTVE